MVYLPGNASPEVVTMYVGAFRTIFARPDFAALAEGELGVNPQLTGDAGRSASDQATVVSPETRTWVRAWLLADCGVAGPVTRLGHGAAGPVDHPIPSSGR
jgi:hypothetical protein